MDTLKVDRVENGSRMHDRQPIEHPVMSTHSPDYVSSTSGTSIHSTHIGTFLYPLRLRGGCNARVLLDTFCCCLPDPSRSEYELEREQTVTYRGGVRNVRRPAPHLGTVEHELEMYPDSSSTLAPHTRQSTQSTQDIRDALRGHPTNGHTENGHAPTVEADANTLSDIAEDPSSPRINLSNSPGLNVPQVELPAVHEVILPAPTVPGSYPSASPGLDVPQIELPAVHQIILPAPTVPASQKAAENEQMRQISGAVVDDQEDYDYEYEDQLGMGSATYQPSPATSRPPSPPASVPVSAAASLSAVGGPSAISPAGSEKGSDKTKEETVPPGARRPSLLRVDTTNVGR